MQSMIDPRLFDEMRKKDIHDLVNQLELYVKQEDFTHPGFYTLLRQLMVPFRLMTSITKTAEKLKIPYCHPTFYDLLNRKIKERLYPLMVAYHRGLSMEGDAVWSSQEGDKRTKVIRTSTWRDKARGLVRKGDSDSTGPEPDTQ